MSMGETMNPSLGDPFTFPLVSLSWSHILCFLYTRNTPNGFEVRIVKANLRQRDKVPLLRHNGPNHVDLLKNSLSCTLHQNAATTLWLSLAIIPSFLYLPCPESTWLLPAPSRLCVCLFVCLFVYLSAGYLKNCWHFYKRCNFLTNTCGSH